MDREMPTMTNGTPRESSSKGTHLSLHPPSVGDERDEFQRFRDLTKNLMAVPKEEVDEQERAYRHKNGSRRRPKPAE